MLPTIFLAANRKSKIKKEVVKTISNILNDEKSLEMKYKIYALYYDSFSEVINTIDQKNKNIIKKNIIIFVDMPFFSVEEFINLRKKIYIFAVWEDIPEHYHTLYKYAQFLYDGLFIEPGYKSLFEVFGLPTYNSSLFYSDLPSFFKYKKPYESLIPIKDRLYDFSFVGRLDRPGRTELIRELNRNFSNVYLHDSSNEYLTSDNLNFIIQNTRFLINLTSVQSKNSYGFKKFPEYLQLQEKSRILEYAASGCILFTETLPKKSFSTLNSKFALPVIEIPRGINKSDFCLEYITNNLNIEKLSRQTYEIAYECFSISNINAIFNKILDDLRINSAKYSEFNLNKIENEQVKYNYTKFIIYREISLIISSKISIKRKFEKFFKLINEQKNNYGFINTCKFIIYLIPMMALNRVQKIF